MILRLALVVIGLALVLGGIFGWKHIQDRRQAAAASRPPPPAVVAAAEVAREEWVPFLSAVGSIVAVREVSIANEIAGKVLEIRFESGNRVAEGEVLVALDASVDRAELEGLQASRKLAELTLKRTETLVEQNFSPPEQLDETRARLREIEAQVAAKEALIAKKSIAAPFAGVLGIRQVNLGQYLAPGTAIATLQALDPLYVDYALPERRLGAVAEGRAVRVSVAAYPGASFEGKVTAISPRVESATRNFRVRATLPNPDGRLRPGMFAEVRTILPQARPVLTVPRTAIAYNPYGDSVFIIEPKGDLLVVERRQVKTGEVRGTRVEVVEGLEAGDRVVNAGGVKLRNGMAVRIDDSVALEEKAAGG